MYCKTVLENGVKIISERLDHMKTVSVGIWVNTGSRDETEPENGVSHFIEHMAFKGTYQRDALQIAKELDAIGGLNNAFTGKENTCFHATVLGKHFLKASDLLSDIFLNSVLDLRDIERERQVILQEISMTEDSPGDSIHDFFDLVFWQNHPMGMPVLGTQKTVSTITRKTIINYLKRLYTPERILIAAAGDVDHMDMVSFFRPLFESAEKAALPVRRESPEPAADIRVRFKELEQVHVCLGGEAPSLRDKKRFATAIFNAILGGNMSSRLFQKIRETQGLAYSVYSYVSSYVDVGLMSVYFATDPVNMDRVLETVNTEILKIARGDISERDLEDAREYLIGGLYISSESTESRMVRIAKNEIVFDRYVPYEEIVSGLEQTTVDQVVQAANEIFCNSKVSMAVLGPVKSDMLNRDLVDFRP